jgi:hypothetical protein
MDLRWANEKKALKRETSPGEEAYYETTLSLAWKECCNCK